MSTPADSGTGCEGVAVAFRREAGRVLATLIRLLGDFDLAEEALQESFTAAIEQWPVQGLPANPRAWLIQVGRNRGIDQMRRQILLRSKVNLEAALGDGLVEGEDLEDEAAFGDDRLRLIFTCCHPALNLEAQVALTLRTVCGLGVEAVARAFLVSEETMAQRLVRAKKKIREAGIPFETPPPQLLDMRIDGVLAAIYLVFGEGYAGSSGDELIHAGLCLEAIRLGRLLETLLPGRSAVRGLLALMLLHDARRSARIDGAGDVVLLEDQNRQLWNREQITEGLALVDQALAAPGPVSPYTIQAAIAALHARASNLGATDWAQIAGLYEVLLRLAPSPVIELNHAVAVSMVDGPKRALDLVDALTARAVFDDYHLLFAVRARLLERLGRADEAVTAYRAALERTRLEPERRLLARRIDEVAPTST